MVMLSSRRIPSPALLLGLALAFGCASTPHAYKASNEAASQAASAPRPTPQTQVARPQQPTSTYVQDEALYKRLVKTKLFDTSAYVFGIPEHAFLPGDSNCATFGRVIVAGGRNNDEIRRLIWPFSQRVNEHLRRTNGVLAPRDRTGDVLTELPSILLDPGDGCDLTLAEFEHLVAKLLTDAELAKKMCGDLAKVGEIKGNRLLEPVEFIGVSFRKLGEDYVVADWLPRSRLVRPRSTE